MLDDGLPVDFDDEEDDGDDLERCPHGVPYDENCDNCFDDYRPSVVREMEKG